MSDSFKSYDIIHEDCGELDSLRVQAVSTEHAIELFWDRLEELQGDCYGITLIDVRNA